MARFMSTVESATALPATAPSGSNANALFANLAASATSGYKLRRITLGVRAGASVPTSQQITIALVRTTVRGTATTTHAPAALDPNSVQTSNIAGLDVAWSAVPTATWTVPYFYEVSINTQSGTDLPAELMEEWIVGLGAGNGMGFINVGNALPTGHLITMSIEHEE